MYQKRVFFDVGTAWMGVALICTVWRLFAEMVENFYRENWKRKMLFNCCKYLKELTKKIVGSFLSM